MNQTSKTVAILSAGVLHGGLKWGTKGLIGWIMKLSGSYCSIDGYNYMKIHKVDPFLKTYLVYYINQAQAGQIN